MTPSTLYLEVVQEFSMYSRGSDRLNQGWVRTLPIEFYISITFDHFDNLRSLYNPYRSVKT